MGAAGLCTSPGAAGTCRFLSNRLPGNKKESIGQQQNYLFFVCCQKIHLNFLGELLLHFKDLVHASLSTALVTPGDKET